jgi:OFA family oxalate/formate antiporter-like MFS transporter
MRRYLVLLSAVTIQITLGGVYAWSVFVPPLQKVYGLSAAQTGLIYGLNICFFTIATVLGGRLMERLGPRLVTAAGGVLFAAGWFWAGCSGGNFAAMILGIGVVLGVGIAFGYVCLLATCVKWFPSHKGLVAGLTMAGFGSGAILLSQLADLFLRGGTDVLAFFRALGLIGGAIVFLAALVIDVPKGQAILVPSHLISLGSLVRQRRFWSLVAGLMAGTFGGQLVAGNLKLIGIWQGLSDQWATLPIAAFAAGSGAGRIAWGWLHDRLGRGTVPVSLAMLGATILLLLVSGASGPIFCVAVVLVGLCYGANFVLYAAEVARFFGVHSVSRAYPWVFVFYAISGTTGPWAGGWMYGMGHTFQWALLLAGCVAIVGAAVHWALREGRPQG